MYLIPWSTADITGQHRIGGIVGTLKAQLLHRVMPILVVGLVVWQNWGTNWVGGVVGRFYMDGSINQEFF